jgi:dimethylhistidine N-methyltransferase
MDKKLTDLGKAVLTGLKGSEKSIPSRFLYDQIGDVLFQEIMALPEYYLSRTEFDLLTEYAGSILSFIDINKSLQLIELGAGDGIKTKILLRKLLEMKTKVEYLPIDISRNALDSLKSSVLQEFPGLKMFPQQAEYFEALEILKGKTDKQKLVLFLGSNIGNMTLEEMHIFLKQLNKNLNKGEYVLIGFDLVKAPETILAAYNDKAGVTKEFNLNLLRRMNRELGANFHLNKWKHAPIFDIKQQAALSFLESTEQQTVYFEELSFKVDFEAGEKINTERSQKFTELQITTFAQQAGFEEVMNFKSLDFEYVCALWKV